MKLIPLSGKLGEGKFVMVDDDMFDYLNQWKWNYRINLKNGYGGYAVRTIYVGHRNTAKRKKVLMHRLILGITDPEIKGDHKDLNGLNNQRYNLRIATNQQNDRNRGVQKNNKCGYKGVWYDTTPKRHNKPWWARITVNRKKISLGHYATAREAAIAYNNGALKYFGEFAWLNSIPSE